MNPAGLPIPDEIDVSPMGQFAAGFEGNRNADWAASRIEQIWRNSVIGDLLARAGGGPKSEYEKVWQNRDIKPAAKAAYVGGRLANDFIGDGSRIPYWFFNHPLAATGALGQMTATAAGLAPDYRKEREQLQGDGQPNITKEMVDKKFAERMGMRYPGAESRGLPVGLARGIIPLTAATSLVAASGNHDILNIAQGGRTRGYEAVLPSENDPRQTTNPLAEAALRYVVGRSGRLLPWEEFTEERPDVSRSDYEAAKAHQFDRGPLGIGLIKGTTRNLEGEPEITAMGFRVPLSGMGAVAGSLGGAVVGARGADRLIEAHIRRRQIDGLKEPPMGDLSLRRKGNRRMLGAALGGISGAIAGNLGTKAVNTAVIQPNLNPERQAEAEAWRRSERARTLVQQQLEAQYGGN